MTEEEFDDYYQNGFKGGRRVNDNKWNGKIRYFESYTYQNGRWNETTLEKLKADLGKDMPEIKKSSEGLFYWIEKRGRDYYICNFPLVGLLYDHIHKIFIYPTPSAVFSENMVFSSKEECEKWIQDEEEKHRGEMTIKTKEQVEAEEQAKRFGSGFPGFGEFESNGNTKRYTFRF